jgi:hypothetical protein
VNSTPDGVEFVADTFTNLSDTPSDYSGFPDYYLKVNSGATAVEFQSAANLESALGGPFLPLTAGESESLSGNLYLDKTSTPTLFLREAGSATDYAYLYDVGVLAGMTKRAVTGNAFLRFDPEPVDNVGNATVQFFRTTDTSGTRNLIIYQGDNTATAQHTFSAAGDVTLCEQAGDLTVAEGVLYLDKTFTPAIHLRENAVNNDRFTISSTAGIHALYAHDGSGQSLVRIDPLPDDGSGAALMQLFRTTSTTGNRYLDIFLGDGTATTQHRFYSTGNVELCKTAGYVKIEEGHLYLDHTTSPSLYLREGGSATDYSRIYDDGNDLNIARYDTDGHAYMYIDAHTSFGSGSGFVNINRNANNFGEGALRVFPSDGTATVVHHLGGDGNLEFCKTGGDLTVEEGTIYVDKTADPGISLREGGSATSYTQLWDDGWTGKLRKVEPGTTGLWIDAQPGDGTSNANIQFFRECNTTGTAAITIHQGDGTSTTQHYLGGAGNANFCQQAGSLQEDGNDVLTEGSAEFSALTEKTTPVSADLLIIEDSAASNAKKKVQMTNLPAGAPSMPLRLDNDINVGWRRYIGVADYYNGSGSQSGAIVIRPFGAAAATQNTFFKFEIHGFCWDSVAGWNESGGWGIAVSGYARTNPDWTTPGAACEILYGVPPIGSVQLGRDASNYHVVVLGTTLDSWDYPMMSVDVWTGYTGADDYDPTDMTITLDASMTSFTFEEVMYLWPQDVILVQNNTGSDITQGKICYIISASGGRPRIAEADADAESTATGQLCMTMGTISASGGVGMVMLRGNYETSGLTAGDVQYLSTTAGAFTSPAPSGVGDIHCSNFTVGTSPTDIEFDAERQTHDDFTHSMVTNPEEVTCNFDGKVKITVTGNILENAANTTWFKLQKNTGAGYADISDSYHYITSAATSNVYNGFSIEIIESVSDGDIIKLVGDATGSTASLQYCRMNLVKLEHGVAPAAANTGVPAHRSVVYTDSQIYAAASTWATVFNLTSHSYDGGMLYYLYNDYASDTAAQRYYFKVTVDGSYVITSNTYLRGGATYSSGIGPIAITQCITPIYFSTQCKLEVGNYGTAGTKYYRYAYYLYDLV